MFKRIALVLTLSALAGGPAAAAGLTGIWQTQPDAKQQTGHVQIVPCGATLCGTVIRAFDRNGAPVTTSSVGTRILWDVRGDGTNGAGTVYVPIMKRAFPVTLAANGRQLNLRACNGIGVCQSQVWMRVR